jgi:hypothetical protein
MDFNLGPFDVDFHDPKSALVGSICDVVLDRRHRHLDDSDRPSWAA